MSQKGNNRARHVKNKFLKKSAELQLAHMRMLSGSMGWGHLESFDVFDPIDPKEVPPEDVTSAIEQVIDFLDSTLAEVNHPSTASDQQGRKLNLQAYLPWLVDQVFPVDLTGMPAITDIAIEDLPALLDDIALFDYWKKKPAFRNHVNERFPYGTIKNPADIYHYACAIGKKYTNGLIVFQQMIKPFRDVGALSPIEREEIDQAFLNDVDASLVHETNDWPNTGFRVIKIHTYEAAKSYGRRTRWCTSHRNTSEWFDKYDDDILLYENSEGQRVQIHFGTAQWRNVHNEDVILPAMIDPNFDLVSIIDERIERLRGNPPVPKHDDISYSPGTAQESQELARVLYPEFEKALWAAAVQKNSEVLFKLRTESSGVQEWKKQLFDNGKLKLFFNRAASEMNGPDFIDLVEEFVAIGRFATPEEIFTKDTVKTVLEKAYDGQGDPATVAQLFTILTQNNNFDSFVTPKDQEKGITLLRSVLDTDQENKVAPWMPWYLLERTLH